MSTVLDNPQSNRWMELVAVSLVDNLERLGDMSTLPLVEGDIIIIIIIYPKFFFFCV